MTNNKNPHRAGRGWTRAAGADVLSYSIPIFVGCKVVAEVRGDTLKKSIKGSAHILRYPPAIAFDISSLKQAQLVGAKYVRVIDKESGDVYFSTMENIWENGVEFNRGCGDQIYLTLDRWQITISNQPAQLNLWEKVPGW